MARPKRKIRMNIEENTKENEIRKDEIDNIHSSFTSLIPPCSCFSQEQGKTNYRKVIITILSFIALIALIYYFVIRSKKYE